MKLINRKYSIFFFNSRRYFSASQNTTSQSQLNQLKDIILNYKSVTGYSDRLRLLTQVAFGAIRDPWRGDLVAATGDISSPQILKEVRRRMLLDPDGKQILADKPRVNETTWNKLKLLALPTNTFGHQYAQWMTRFDFSSNERPLVRYVPDLELAYIIQRYREIHDTLHVLLNYDITVAEELAVKWYEMIQIQLPSTALAAFVGPFNLLFVSRDLGQLDQLMRVYLPHIMQQAQNSQFFMNIYFEKHFETDIDDLRYKLGIKPLQVTPKDTVTTRVV